MDDNITSVAVERNGETVWMGTPDDLDGLAQAVGRKTSQLSFDLGMRPSNRPDFGTVKVSGSLLVTRDIWFGDDVVVTVTDTHGEVLASGSARCDWPQFRTTTDSYGLSSTERKHTVKIGEGD